MVKFRSARSYSLLISLLVVVFLALVLLVNEVGGFRHTWWYYLLLGLLVGLSSGAALAGALQVADSLAESGEPATIVTILADNGYKYLSGAPYEQE